MAARKKPTKTNKQVPVVPKATVESRPLGVEEEIEKGTVLVVYGAETGKETFLRAMSGFGMNPDNEGKIMGIIGDNRYELQENIWKDIVAHHNNPNHLVMDNTGGYCHRYQNPRVVTTPLHISDNPLDEAGTVKTTSGKYFTGEDHAKLAALIYRRFGEDLAQARAAWQRMLHNSCSVSDFRLLLENAGITS